MVTWLTQIFKGIWASGHVPDDWRKGIILHFDKGKGSRPYSPVQAKLVFCCLGSKISCSLFAELSRAASLHRDQQWTA